MKELVFAAGLLHFCQVPATVVILRWFGTAEDLLRLKEINRRFMKVTGFAILYTVNGLGLVVVIAPGEVVEGGLLGAGLACFLGIFWLYRGVAQVAAYGPLWPKGGGARALHYFMSVLFFTQSTIYFAAFAFNLTR